MKRLRTTLAAAALLLPLSLLAATVDAPTAFDKFMSLATGAGKTTVTLGSNGTPLAAPGVPRLETDGGLPKATVTGSVTNPAGNRIPVTATARVPAAEVAGATGRLLGKLAKNAAVYLGVGLALYEFGKELNFIFSRNPDGTVKVEKTDLNICTVAPCFTYSYEGANYNNGPYTTGPQPSRAAACSRLIAVKSDPVNSSPNTQGWYFTNQTMSGTTCFADLYNKEGVFQGNISQGIATATPVAPASSSSVPSSEQEFIDAVAAKSGWPSTSKVAQVLEESAAQTGVRVKTGPMTVTGPATSPGTQSVTNNTANNTTKTETTTYNHTYQGDTINTTAVTVTNITNTTTGEPISSETKTETPEKEEDPPEVEVSDTPLPAQPKLYTPKYPNGLEGVWAQQKADLSSTPLANLAGRLMPNVGSSGTCPTMSIDLSLAAWADFGVKDVAPPCHVWGWARLIVLIGALLLARALIFGG
jgi:hypothetical protein